ncbi:hypothetical protein CALCODRAFT_329393 [Calocera cornea HHB12733]|uniref:F-box domain-containing protein n=1 Tax=Calocera cornea HHB12733 TaxID=1353952 RepID=A0A165JJ78_9BASI|nr:hypothetical protein CALCODRAFT_329393 [Calocera cornea HHB12733]
MGTQSAISPAKCQCTSASGSTTSSSIERLPTELLDEILRYLYLEGALRCALVARAWVPRARRVIYGQISLSTRHDDEALRCWKLCHTLSACPDARYSVRYLEMCVYPWANNALLLHLGWLNDLRAGQLRRITIRVVDAETPTAHIRSVLLASPARTSVTVLDVSGRFLNREAGPASSPRTFDFPRLESLSVTLDRNDVCLAWHPLRCARLSHLTIRAYGYTEAMSQLMDTLAESVVSLHIQWPSAVGISLEDPERTAMSRALSKLAQLEKLHINLNLAEPAPILDDVLPHLRCLKELKCTAGTCSAHVFSCLPPTLERLYMYYPSEKGYSLVDPALLRYGSTVALRVASGDLALRTFHYAIKSEPKIEEEFTEECRNAGIEFLGWSFYHDR